jgi:hypothetical protein
MPPKCQVCISADAKYGKKGGPKLYCKDCAKNIEGVGNLTRKHCKETTCFSEPTYNFPTEKTTAYCSLHKLPGMIDVKHKKCEHVDENGICCDKGPTYGPEGGKPIYCEPHSALYENMVMVITNRLCKYVDEDGNKCGTRAGYNKPGIKTPLWCGQHKKEGDEYTNNNVFCKFVGCKTRANQNYPNEKKPLYCELHRLEGMWNVIDKHCYIDGCSKLATHGFPNKGLETCGEHKIKGMKDLKRKECAYNGCDKHASYNVPGRKGKLFCAEHADKETMDNVKNKKCKKCNDSLAVCNYKGLKSRIYCCRCRLPDMVNLSKTICKNDYILDNGEKYECLTEIAHMKYDGYCTRCFVGLFPNAPITKNFKTKEVRVYEYIKSMFPDVEIVTDKIISTGFSKRRPDMCIYKDEYSIIIEVDEFQHGVYETICENKRMMELFIDLQNKPLVIIRFNPDAYTNAKNKKINSCWSISKANGMAIINKNKIVDWNNRLNKLKQTLTYYLQNPPTKELEVQYLYYNQSTQEDIDDIIEIEDDNIQVEGNEIQNEIIYMQTMK